MTATKSSIATTMLTTRCSTKSADLLPISLSARPNYISISSSAHPLPKSTVNNLLSCTTSTCGDSRPSALKSFSPPGEQACDGEDHNVANPQRVVEPSLSVPRNVGPTRTSSSSIRLQRNAARMGDTHAKKESVKRAVPVHSMTLIASSLPSLESFFTSFSQPLDSCSVIR